MKGPESAWQMGGEFLDRQAGNFLTQEQEIPWQMGGECLDKREIFKFSRKAMLPVDTSYCMPSACSVMYGATAVLSSRISK